MSTSQCPHLKYGDDRIKNSWDFLEAAQWCMEHRSPSSNLSTYSSQSHTWLLSFPSRWTKQTSLSPLLPSPKSVLIIAKMLKGREGRKEEGEKKEERRQEDCNYSSHGCFACLMEFCNYQMNQLQTCIKLIWSRWGIKGTEICDEVLMLLNYFQDFFNKICDDKFPRHDVKNHTIY